MDGHRFDAITRSVAGTSTRRGALGAFAAGGLLSALGLKPGRAFAQDTTQDQDQNQDQGQTLTCVVDFSATVRQGPSAGQAAGQVRGELTFGLSGRGALENASLRLPNGSEVPVVGQATGRSLDLRIGSGANQTVIAMGVGEREIADCQGAIDGLATGPAAGDLGDWHATVLRSTGSAGGGGNRDRSRTGRTGAAGQAAGGRQGGGGQGSGGGQGGGGQGGGRGGRNRGATGPTGPGGTTGTTGATGPTSGAAQCTAGQTDCNGACVDLQTDLNNCGACGNACESGLVAVECRSGVCERANCPVGQEFCGAVDGCRDLSTDPDHCGACGNACGDAFCVSGVCEATQPAGDCAAQGLTDCGGTCVDLATDEANCGTCGAACAAGEECSGGGCVATAAADACAAQGLTNCGGVCVNTQTDFGNCGGCGIACPQSNECVSGVCTALATVDCAAQGLTECVPGTCTDLQTDLVNCGGCGVVCANQCVAGVCS